MVSSKGAMRMPWRAKIFQSYFMFWPIFRIDGVFQHRLQRGERFGQVQLAFDQVGRAEKIAAALLVAERDIGGLAGIDAQRNADKFGLHLVQAGGFGIDGDMADVA